MIHDIEFPIPHSEPLHDSESETPHGACPPWRALRAPHSHRGRPLVFDALKQHTFLRLVAVGFSTRSAARLVGVSPSTVREKARTSPPFACGYEDAKAQAIPSLAENVFHAGQRSWRASAWLLERLRPSHFGRRVALGPDPAKRREDERLRDEKKKEQLDLQKPELNDQILIRCIHRLLTDHRAREIFFAYADDFDRKAAEQAQAAGGEKPQSPTSPVDDSDSAPVQQSTDHAAPPDQSAADDLPTHGGQSDLDQAQLPIQEPCGNPQDLAAGSPSNENDDTLTVTDAPPPHSPNNCAPLPSANNSPPPRDRNTRNSIAATSSDAHPSVNTTELLRIHSTSALRRNTPGHLHKTTTSF